MSFRERSETTAQAVLGVLAASPTEDQNGKVVAIIEQALVDAVAEANRRCTQVAQNCCSADRDLAHKIAGEIERAHQALIANLSSLR
jgi:hypothetical protein